MSRAAERVPRVHHAVVAEGDVDAGGQQLGHARHAAALRVAVVAALQRDVDQRVGDGVHAGLAHQRQQLGHVVVVHRVHRGQVRAGHAALQPEPLRLEGERLDVARQRVVALVAVHVHAQAALGGELAEHAHALRAVGHGALEVRDAADHVDAQVERALQVGQRGGRAQHAVLREGDELQVEVRLHALAHVQQRLDGEQPVVADVDMRADRQQPLGHRPVAVLQRTLDQRLLRQLRLELAPQRDAFEQRAAGFTRGRP